MKELDLKQIWNNFGEKKPEEKRYSLEDIYTYRRKRSKSASRASRLGILFDIGYKSTVLVMLIVLILILDYQYPFQIIIALLIAVTCALIFLESRYLKKLTEIKETESVIENLKEKLKYLKTTFKKFIFVGGLSNPLLFIAGMFLYDHFKYGAVQARTPSDDLILYIMLVFSYLLSVFGQWPFYKNHVKELQESIDTLDDVKIASIKIEEARKRRIRFIIVSSILALIGILLLLIIFIR